MFIRECINESDGELQKVTRNTSGEQAGEGERRGVDGFTRPSAPTVVRLGDGGEKTEGVRLT